MACCLLVSGYCIYNGSNNLQVIVGKCDLLVQQLGKVEVVNGRGMANKLYKLGRT